jgi:hypothetical protein
MSEVDWIALGVAVTLFAALLGYRIGRRQVAVASEAHTLSATKAAVKLGTKVHIDKRQENPPGFPPFYYLMATIHNEGELPAKQVNGYWKLYSPTKSIKEQRIPFGADFLGSSPIQLESHRLDDGISGMSIDLNGIGAQNIRIDVDFELDYVGLTDEQTHHYGARYQYDHASRQMVRI